VRDAQSNANMRNKRLLIYISILAIAALLAEGWFVFRGFKDYETELGYYISMPNAGKFHKLTGSDPVKIALSSTTTDVGGRTPAGRTTPTTTAATAPGGISMLLNVPFTSQAPSGNWDNVVFQQGCEEASMLMAMLWVQKKGFISPKEAEKAISAISNFAQKNYGEFRDTSIEDTAIIMKDYFDYQNIEVKNDITANDIKSELAKGNVVIAAINGRKIGNPFYTPPGPQQHMLIVKGYDAQKKEFITNDPGTRRGEGFRYKEDILEAALRDYATGYKKPFREIHKSMIVISLDEVAR